MSSSSVSTSSNTSAAQVQMSETSTSTDGYDDGYFVMKGSCRRCGRQAYFKQQCKRCMRKYCGDCAPFALQMYHVDSGDNQEDENEVEWCCIGCEPHMVIAAKGQEPILELEPESEVIPMFDDLLWSSAVRPIHVPVSATIAAPSTERADEEYDNDREQKENHCQVKDTHEAVGQTESDGSETLISPKPLPKLGAGKSSPPSSDRTIGTSTSTVTLTGNDNTRSLDEHDEQKQQLDETVEQVWVSRRGCCSACQQFARGKRPCNGCGRKYCSDEVCVSYLSHVDCAMCCPNPVAPMPEPGCCAACFNYATGKKQCQGCGLKYCANCDARHILANGRCTKCCHSKMVQPSATVAVVPAIKVVDFSTENTVPSHHRPERGCCAHCDHYAKGKTPCRGCGLKYCQQAECSAQLYSQGACCTQCRYSGRSHQAQRIDEKVHKANGAVPSLGEGNASIFSVFF